MIKIGSTCFVCFHVLYRNKNKAGVWLTTNISIHTGSWHGQYNADLQLEELLGLKNDLEALRKKPQYRFVFAPKEPWIKLIVSGTTAGQAAIEGEACDSLIDGNKLTFSFKMNQSSLPKLFEDFKEALKKFQ